MPAAFKNPSTVSSMAPLAISFELANLVMSLVPMSCWACTTAPFRALRILPPPNQAFSARFSIKSIVRFSLTMAGVSILLLCDSCSRASTDPFFMSDLAMLVNLLLMAGAILEKPAATPSPAASLTPYPNACIWVSVNGWAAPYPPVKAATTLDNLGNLVSKFVTAIGRVPPPVNGDRSMGAAMPAPVITASFWTVGFVTNPVTPSFTAIPLP